MLLDPFEKKFDLPAGFVQLADGGWRKTKQVGEEDECLSCLWILEANTSQLMRRSLLAVETGQRHRLIADDSLGPIAGRRIDAPQVGIRWRG